ncbi:MAG: DUF3040 domain-containing protein [Actinomycetes bacterium]
MPLSDHERRLLAEMEAALQQDDPRLVSTMTGKARTRQSSRVLIGSLLLLSGMAILLTGLISQTIPVGIVGFIVALIGVVFIFSNLGGAGPTHAMRGERGAKPKKAPWSSRLEERWDRRNFEN